MRRNVDPEIVTILERIYALKTSTGLSIGKVKIFASELGLNQRLSKNTAEQLNELHSHMLKSTAKRVKYVRDSEFFNRLI